LQIRSSVGAGSTFTCTFPLDRVTNPEELREVV
jgi:hypothetical protein